MSVSGSWSYNARVALGAVRRRFTAWVAGHPVAPVSLRASVAAVVSWAVVLPLGGLADDYPYYAPMGAVVVMSTTLARSVRTTMQAALAIFLAATLAVFAHLMPLPKAAAIGLVVGLGTAATAWRRLGSMASWVPVSALFILVLGAGSPLHYVAAYLGLFTLGAVVGIAVNAVFPPLPMGRTERVEESLRAALATQLEDLAAGLEQDPLQTSGDWNARGRDLESRSRHLQDLVAQGEEMRLANWRAARRPIARHTVAQERSSRALANLAWQVRDITDLLASGEREDRSQDVLGPTLRPPAARALRMTAWVLRSLCDATADPNELHAARRATKMFGSAIRTARTRHGVDLFEAGALWTALQRALDALSEGASRRESSTSAR